MKLTKKSLIALLLAVVVLVGLGGATLAFAAPSLLAGRGPGWPWGTPGGWPGGFGRGGAVGTVKSVDAAQLVLTEADSKTITVTITSQTKVYLMPGRTEGKVADIKVGDTAQVTGRPNASHVLEAQTITVGPLELRVSGQVTGVDGSNITVQAGQGTQTIVTDANTKFFAAGQQAAALADVKAGEFVTALVQKQTDGSLLATQVMVGAQGGFGRGPGGKGGMMGQPWADENRVGGQVAAVDGVKITVQISPTTQTTQSTQIIVTDANTKFFAAGKQAATLADVKTGEFVMALVQKQTDGSLLATQVMIGIPGGFGRGYGRGGMMGQPGLDENRVGGQVTVVDGAKITVQVGQSTQTVVTDANTKFFAGGKQPATLADVKTGEYVMALVQKQTDGSLLATQVMVGNLPGMGPGRMVNPHQRQWPGARPTPLAPGTNS